MIYIPEILIKIFKDRNTIYREDIEFPSKYIYTDINGNSHIRDILRKKLLNKNSDYERKFEDFIGKLKKTEFLKYQKEVPVIITDRIIWNEILNNLGITAEKELNRGDRKSVV